MSNGGSGDQAATTADEVVVVELTNPTDEALAVTMHLGGTSRRIATLAGGRSILLVSPPGASWGFTAAAGTESESESDASFDDEDMAPTAGEGDRGRKIGQ